jgi:hypothetical protein
MEKQKIALSLTVFFLILLGTFYYFYTKDKVYVKVFCGSENTCSTVDKLREEFGDRVIIDSCGVGVSAECANEGKKLGFTAYPSVVVGDKKIENSISNWNEVKNTVCNRLVFKWFVC